MGKTSTPGRVLVLGCQLASAASVQVLPVAPTSGRRGLCIVLRRAVARTVPVAVAVVMLGGRLGAARGGRFRRMSVIVGLGDSVPWGGDSGDGAFGDRGPVRCRRRFRRSARDRG